MNGWQSCPKHEAFSGVPFLTCNAATTMYGRYCEGNVQVVKVEAAVTRTSVGPVFETYCCKGWVSSDTSPTKLISPLQEIQEMQGH